MSKNFSWVELQSWLLGSRYLIVTLSIMSFLIILPYTFTQYVYFGRIVLAFWLALILVALSLSVYRIKIGGKIGLLLIAVNLAATILNLSLGSYPIAVINRLLNFITFSFVSIIIFVDLATVYVEKRGRSDYVWGGIAIYLLIGLTWGALYNLVELVTPGSFLGPESLGTIEFPLFVYFSYYVLTTVGGVLTPITLQAQSLVMIEPIVGTLYVAILVARLVNHISARKQAKPDSSEQSTK
ncbi:MAG: hypothetical protein NWF01_10480 [Candidatus Bathyarchaeota archaeon]|nr:hypothetical protein [Candidatus Bathyarchaeota archaeon]